jgi:hypothetical protein
MKLFDIDFGSSRQLSRLSSLSEPQGPAGIAVSSGLSDFACPMIQNSNDMHYGKVSIGIGILLILVTTGAFAYLRFGPVPVAVSDRPFLLRNGS